MLELISGLSALEIGKSTNQNGAVLDWVKKIHGEKQLEMLVDNDIKNIHDRIELEDMVQVALLCTQNLPSQRPKMSEVVRMLEDHKFLEKWVASRGAETTTSKGYDFSNLERYSDMTGSSLKIQAIELSGPSCCTAVSFAIVVFLIWSERFYFIFLILLLSCCVFCYIGWLLLHG
ncbi:NSP-interacting kinase-like protein [Melia azedarach]|uniref:NSP-interacting kinase-like protein n=1 Tax=Melia azedarach TaxID=155640 RepID=A0ACC1Y5F3_MELAZ|nr:NSP-interacting kinase-like protein [Melia azedarach]